MKNLIKKHFVRCLLMSAGLVFIGYASGWFRNSSLNPSWLSYVVYYIVTFLVFLILNVLTDVLIIFIRRKKKK